MRNNYNRSPCFFNALDFLKTLLLKINIAYAKYLIVWQGGVIGIVRAELEIAKNLKRIYPELKSLLFYQICTSLHSAQTAVRIGICIP